MAIDDRIKRLEGGEPEFCAPCPYRKAPRHLTDTRTVDADGNEIHYERDPRDDGSPAVCDKCPYAEVHRRARPVHTVTVVRRVVEAS